MKTTDCTHDWRVYPSTGRAMCLKCREVLTKEQAEKALRIFPNLLKRQDKEKS